MNRRNFFKGLIGAVVAGAALTASQQAAAQLFGLNKYAEMVRLQQDAIKLHEEIRGEAVFVTRFNPRSKEMSIAINEVFGFAMDNFKGDATSPEAYQGCSELFNNPKAFDTMSEDGLKQIMEVLVPVAVARNLLAVHRVTFDPKHTVCWNQFSDKYQDMILQA